MSTSDNASSRSKGEAGGHDDVQDIQKSVNQGLAWVGLASSLVGLLDILATFLIVVFWIPQEDFGKAAFAFTLFPILDLATDLGLAAAVIQRDDHSASRIATIFWLNLAMSLTLFCVLAFGVGPLLALIQGHPILAGLLTAYGAKLVWQNVYFLPHALMKKELRFKELSAIRIVANLAEFAGKVGLAAGGFGIWCFVAGPLCRAAVTGIGVQMRHPWMPSLSFNAKEGWDWAKFGLKTSAHKMLFRLYSLLDKQVVGYYFGDASLGVYVIAYQVVLEPALIISEITANVAFPAFSKLKHKTSELFEQLVTFCRMNLVVMMLFVGFTFVATEEILAAFSLSDGSDYSSGAPIVRLLCGVAILRALSFVIPPFLDGVGRPLLNLKYAAVAAIVLSICFVISANILGERLGATSVAVGWLVGYPVAFLVLVSMAFALLEISSYQLYRRLAGVAVCGLLSTGLAGLTKWAAMGFAAPVRVGLIVLVMGASYMYLLARFEGISIRTVRAAVTRKTSPPPRKA